MKHFATGFRQKPDERDAQFPLSKLMGAGATRPILKAWKAGPVLDQGRLSACVGFSCFQFLASEPVVIPNPRVSPFDIYGEARKIDEWTDNDDIDQGTSVRAGLNVLRNLGLIRAYYWAFDAEQCLDYLLRFGPLVFGTRWSDSMNEPDSDGYVRPVGRGGGGHAYFCYAANWPKKEFIFRNSWGTVFGKDGDFRMTLSDMDRLLSESGACAAAVIE